jgi:predicted NAD-dependent protein-ADP-ribosyltransferase YbiA (DUF1768 family)
MTKDDKLMFFSRSANKDPGKGVDEYVSNPKKYNYLSGVKDWRKHLSNFWPVNVLKIDGKTWYSSEHYFHSMKFRLKNPKFADTFSLESGSEWSRDPLMSKMVGGKTGKWKKVQKRPLNVEMRSDFYDGYNKKVMTIAMYNKFGQNHELWNILKATNDAQLTHKTRGIPLTRIDEMERVRHCLNIYPYVHGIGSMYIE